MNKLLVSLAAIVLTTLAVADDCQECTVAGGSFLVGTVTEAPSFANGKVRRDGIWLSHTLLTVADEGGHHYRVAVDNVFANGYVQNRRGVPGPLNTIQVGDRLELCGQAFSDPGQDGIHWVHTNCGARPTLNKPDGWIKQVGRDGKVGPNMEANTRYCGLW
jgi:hypothetical protein